MQEDGAEVSIRDGSWAEDLVEIFGDVGARIFDDAEGADAEIGRRGGATCCEYGAWDDVVGREAEGLWVERVRGSEERDVEVHVGYLGRWMDGCWCELEVGELEGCGEDDGVVACCWDFRGG